MRRVWGYIQPLPRLAEIKSQLAEESSIWAKTPQDWLPLSADFHSNLVMDTGWADVVISMFQVRKPKTIAEGLFKQDPMAGSRRLRDPAEMTPK